MIERSGPIQGLIIYLVWLRFMVVLSFDRTGQQLTIFLKQKALRYNKRRANDYLFFQILLTWQVCT